MEAFSGASRAGGDGIGQAYFSEGGSAVGAKGSLFPGVLIVRHGKSRQTERFLMEAGRMREAGEGLPPNGLLPLDVPIGAGDGPVLRSGRIFTMSKPSVPTCRLDFSASLGEDEL